MLNMILAVVGLSTIQAAEVKLERVFKAGEKTQFEVKSHLLIEAREGDLSTFIPEEVDYVYKSTSEVKEMKADGISDVLYLRPTMSRIIGETFNSPPKTIIDKTNINVLATVSPINEILSMKDLTPKKDEKKPGGKGERLRVLSKTGVGTQPSIGQWIQEIYRLSLFIGDLNSSLDFSPKLPLDPVKPGDTWKRTVGYSPQQVGKDGKSAVQRLDYTFTYVGEIDSDNRKVYRVTATLDLDTDIAPWFNQLMGHQMAEEVGLKSVKLKLKAKIDFDLDKVTRRTIQADANSEGGVSVMISQSPNAPIMEQRIKGTTTLRTLAYH